MLLQAKSEQKSAARSRIQKGKDMTADESEALMYMRTCSVRGCAREMLCMSISAYHFPQHDSGISTFAMRHCVKKMQSRTLL